MYRSETIHIDLWGKYSVVSINGHQYYIVFVDDAGRYITVDFLKTQGKNPRAIRVDGGKEFINQNLLKTELQNV